MKESIFKTAAVIFMAVIIFASTSLANVPEAKLVNVSDQELQEVYGQGCLEDCALAATYTALSIFYWYYIPLAAIYAYKCANCGGNSGGGGEIPPCCPEGSYEEEYSTCQQIGSQILGQSTCSTNANRICCRDN